MHLDGYQHLMGSTRQGCALHVAVLLARRLALVLAQTLSMKSFLSNGYMVVSVTGGW